MENRCIKGSSAILLIFRHLLEKHDLGEQIFRDRNRNMVCCRERSYNLDEPTKPLQTELLPVLDDFDEY